MGEDDKPSQSTFDQSMPSSKNDNSDAGTAGIDADSFTLLETTAAATLLEGMAVLLLEWVGTKLSISIE